MSSKATRIPNKARKEKSFHPTTDISDSRILLLSIGSWIKEIEKKGIKKDALGLVVQDWLQRGLGSKPHIRTKIKYERAAYSSFDDIPKFVIRQDTKALKYHYGKHHIKITVDGKPVVDENVSEYAVNICETYYTSNDFSADFCLVYLLSKLETMRSINYHMAVPPMIYDKFFSIGYRIEGFSNPMNHFLPHYFSLNRVDRKFGSLGNFFESDQLPEGYMVVNPPYTEMILEDAVKKCLSSYIDIRIVFVGPEWPDSKFHKKLSGYNSFLIQNAAFYQAYTNQIVPTKDTRVWLIDSPDMPEQEYNDWYLSVEEIIDDWKRLM